MAQETSSTLSCSASHCEDIVQASDGGASDFRSLFRSTPLIERGFLPDTPCHSYRPVELPAFGRTRDSRQIIGSGAARAPAFGSPLAEHLRQLEVQTSPASLDGDEQIQQRER
jgi:hypothetical protein